MNSPLLLDTCALIWSSAADAGSGLLRSILADAQASQTELWASPISAWEIGNLVARGRIVLASPVLPWFQSTLRKAGLRQADLGARELVASTDLPGTLHRDPADRIIVATAREHGLTIVTRDALILSYSQQGHVLALAC